VIISPKCPPILEVVILRRLFDLAQCFESILYHIVKSSLELGIPNILEGRECLAMLVNLLVSGDVGPVLTTWSLERNTLAASIVSAFAAFFASDLSFVKSTGFFNSKILPLRILSEFSTAIKGYGLSSDPKASAKRSSGRAGCLPLLLPTGGSLANLAEAKLHLKRQKFSDIGLRLAVRPEDSVPVAVDSRKWS